MCTDDVHRIKSQIFPLSPHHFRYSLYCSNKDVSADLNKLLVDFTPSLSEFLCAHDDSHKTIARSLLLKPTKVEVSRHKIQNTFVLPETLPV